MDACQNYEQLIAEALFGALSEEEQARLDAHLKACGACATAYQEMRETLAFSSLRERPAPPDAFWDGYYGRLVERMETPARGFDWQGTLNAWGERLRMALWGSPRLVVQLSGAVALVAVGIFIGWLVFQPAAPAPTPVIVENPDTSSAMIRPVSLEARTSRYLERSKVLLLGLVNFDPAEAEAGVLNLPRKQAIARELVDEASGLKDELTASDQALLHALIADLEVILLQIANLEAGYDIPAIDLVKSGVDRQGILLKINLSEMQQPEPEL